jgi:O-antigen ligase
VVEWAAQSTEALRARSLGPLAWAATGGAAALVVAGAASFSPTAAIGASAAIVAVAAVVANPALFTAILAGSIFVELIRVEGTTISRVLAPIALVVVVVQLVRGRSTVPRAAPLVWAGAYCLWAVASGLWTTSTGGTLFLLASLGIAVVYMLAFAALLQSQRDLENLLWVLAVASLLFGILSLQHISFGATEATRAQGGIGDPNLFAATQLVVLPLVLALAGQTKKPSLQIGLYAAVLAVIGSVVTSLSRGGLVGLAVLLVLIILAPFHLLFRSRRRKALALLAVGLGVAALSIQQSSQLAGRIETIFEATNPAAQQGSGRLELWRAATHSIEKHPWLGLGFGGFIAHSEQLLLDTPGVDLSHYSLRTRGQPVHDTYLESLADLGILGLALYVGVLVATARSLRRTARAARRAQAPLTATIAGALLLALATWSVTSVFLSTETVRIFWILVGLTLALPRLLEAEQRGAVQAPASDYAGDGRST